MTYPLSFLKGFLAVVTLGALVTLFLAIAAQHEVDQMVDPELVAVNNEKRYIICAVDRRGHYGITFDYNMRETCVGIMSAEGVL